MKLLLLFEISFSKQQFIANSLVSVPQMYPTPENKRPLGLQNSQVSAPLIIGTLRYYIPQYRLNVVYHPYPIGEDLKGKYLQQHI